MLINQILIDSLVIFRMMLKRFAFSIQLTLFFTTLFPTFSVQAEPFIERISTSPDGTQANSIVYSPVLSADGRYVAFYSSADNLVPNDTNHLNDIFVKDLQTGTVTRPNTNRFGTQANGGSILPKLSGDGRYVIFNSAASNLVPGDTNRRSDIFVKDIQTGITTLVSSSSEGTLANQSSFSPVLSADGRFAAFSSNANNLVPNDTNSETDIFIKNLQTGSLTRVNTDNSGEQANYYSSAPALSSSGRYVAFVSSANNLAANDNNAKDDIFIKDMQTGNLRIVSIGEDGKQGHGSSYSPSISADGRYIAFQSHANNLVPDGDLHNATDIFVKDMLTGTLTLVSTNSNGAQANSHNMNPSLSANGRFVVFESSADNLVPNDTNQTSDIFVKDLETGVLIRLSTAQNGQQANASSASPRISADGNYIVFTSVANNLVDNDNNNVSDAFRVINPLAQLDQDTDEDGLTNAQEVQLGTDPLSPDTDNDGLTDSEEIGFDGSFDEGLDTNPVDADTDDDGDSDGIEIRFGSDPLNAMSTLRLYIASTDSNRQQVSANSDFASISENGRYVVFTSSASDLIDGDDNNVNDVFLKDTQSGLVRRLSQNQYGIGGNGTSDMTTISADGRYAVFSSAASNLTDDDSNGFRDIFLAELATGQLTRLTHGNGDSDSPSITADGQKIVFSSGASDLVDNDKNGLKDVFIYPLGSGIIERVSTTPDGTSGNGSSYGGIISANGQFVAFRSGANNLIEHDSNGVHDVFQKNLQTGVIARISVSTTGEESQGLSRDVSVNANGRYLVFSSEADNLINNDSNAADDVFIKDTWTGILTAVSQNATGAQGNGHSYHAAINQTGRYVIFSSKASNLVEGDDNGLSDIFVKDLQSGQVARINISDDGEQSFRRNTHPQISATGKYLLFASDAPNLVANDTNNARDVFRVINPLFIETADSDGDGLDDTVEQRLGTDEHDSDSDNDGLSDSDEVGIDGHYDTMVDTNPLNPDSDGDGYSDSKERRLLSDPLDPNDRPVTIVRVSTAKNGDQGIGRSYSSAPSADGRYVAFSSNAYNLLADNVDHYTETDIFVKDMQTGAVTLASTPQDLYFYQSFSPAISADGRYVTFHTISYFSESSDSSDVFIKDLYTGAFTQINTNSESKPANGFSYSPSISADGRYVAFDSDANNLGTDEPYPGPGIYVKDLQTMKTKQISLAGDGTQANGYSEFPAISADGRYIAFESTADNLVTGDTNETGDIFVKNLTSNSVVRASEASDGTEANKTSRYPVVSANGRFIAFESDADSLVPGDSNNVTDIFVKDIVTGTLKRVSTSAAGIQGNKKSLSPAISDDGRFVVFHSYANNLVDDDTNRAGDIFVKDLQTNAVKRANITFQGIQANSSSSDPAISADGRYVTFDSLADNLVDGDTNDALDVFRTVNPLYECCSD